MTTEATTKKVERSDHVQDIIERMPNKFGFWVTAIVILMVALLFFFGVIIQYPDTVSGQITINAKYSPVKLVAAASGKIKLFKYQAKELVNEGDYIAVIQNPADIDDLLRVKNLVVNFNLTKNKYRLAYLNFPKKVSLGEINARYYTFLSALHRIYSNALGNSFYKQEEGLKYQISQLSSLLGNLKKLESTRLSNMALYKKISDRDSVLLLKGGTIEAEADQSQILYLNSKAGYQGINNEINNTQQRINEYNNKLQMLYIQRSDEEDKLHLDLISAYDDLKDIIVSWEQKYAFISPMKGQVDFMKFWSDNQFVQAGDEVFSVIPKNNKIIGQLNLPTGGAGKVKPGQEIIVKLDNYPFREFGSVKGRVSTISLTTNLVNTANQKDVNVYLIEVELPEDLTTNYGEKLSFKYEIKGIGEIITNKRNLLERFFDNLRYATKKSG